VISEKILVFIPVKNEEKTIRDVITEVSKRYPMWDILVVDDGSDDATAEEARKTKAIVIPLLLNTRGVGAVLTAFMVANKGKYDYLVKIDGDGQQEADVLRLLIDAIKENHVDIAVGSRYVKKQEETDSFIRVIGRVVSSSLLNFKLRGRNKITDSTSGVRAWNSKSIELLTKNYHKHILTHDSVFWLHEAVLASRLGLKIHEIPAFYHPRKHGKSKSFSFMNMCIFPFRLLVILIS
jgi:glycosyltransferase involved in cell wall biosynthesis